MISKLGSFLKRIVRIGVLAGVALVLVLILDAVLLSDEDDGRHEVDPD